MKTKRNDSEAEIMTCYLPPICLVNETPWGLVDGREANSDANENYQSWRPKFQGRGRGGRWRWRRGMANFKQTDIDRESCTAPIAQIMDEGAKT